MLTAAHVLLIAAFVAGYLAAYVDPRHVWWIQPAGVLLPLLTVLVVLAAAGSVFFGAWRLAGVHAVLLFLAAGRFISLPERVAATDRDPLRAMTLNARFSWDVQNAFPDNTVDSLVAVEEPHVMALQEADIVFERDSSTIAMLMPVEIRLEERGYNTLPPEGTGRRQYNPVVARIPMEERTEYFIDRSNPGKRSPTVTRTLLDWQGEQIALYAVHLKSFSGTPDEERAMRGRWNPLSWPERYSIMRETYRTHAEQVDELVRMLRTETRPFIVCGDLNSTPNNWSYRRLGSIARDAFETAGEGRGATYPALFPLVRIDFIFAGPGWTVVDAWTADPALSDHRALFADLAR